MAHTGEDWHVEALGAWHGKAVGAGLGAAGPGKAVMARQGRIWQGGHQL